MWVPSGRLEALGPQRRPSRTETFAAICEIEECHDIAGEADFLLKIRARDTRHLTAIIKRLEATLDVFSTETEVVVSGAFERRPNRSLGLLNPLAQMRRSR